MLDENINQLLLDPPVKNKPLDNSYVVVCRGYDEKKYKAYFTHEMSGGHIFNGGYKSAKRLTKANADKIVKDIIANQKIQDGIKLPYAIAVLYRDVVAQHAEEERRLTDIQKGSLTALKHYGNLSRYRLNVCSRASPSTVKWLLKNELAEFDSEDIHLSITKKGLAVLKAGKLN